MLAMLILAIGAALTALVVRGIRPRPTLWSRDCWYCHGSARAPEGGDCYMCEGGKLP